MRRNERRRKRLIAAGLVLVSIVLAVAGLMRIKESARHRGLIEARTAALAAYASGDYAEALPRFGFVVSRDATDVEVLLAFADARTKIPLENDRHLRESIGLYLAALQQEPTNMTALEGLLELYERTARRLEWIETADRVLTIEPDHIDALRLKASGHALVSEFDQAQEYLSRLIAIQPDELRWRVAILQILLDLDTPVREILAVCDAWIAEATDGDRGDRAADGRFLMLKAGFLASVGERDEARSMARVAAAPEHGAAAAEVLQQLLALLDSLRLTSEATKLIEQTKTRFPQEHWPHEAAVRRLWQHGLADEGLRAIDAARTSLGSLSVGLMRWKSLLLIQKNELDRARHVLGALEELAVTKAEGDRDAHRAWLEAVRARIEFGGRNWSESLAAYRRAIALEPGDPVLHYLLGEAYLRVGEDELGSEALERATRSDPNWIAAQMLYAESLLRLGQAETAARVTAALVRRVERPSFGLYLLFARSWMASGLTARELGVLATGEDGFDPVRFLEVLRNHAPPDSPENAEVIKLLVQNLLEEGEVKRASEVIEEVLANERTDPSLLVGMARSSAKARLGFEQQLIDRAVAEMGMTLEIAEVQARVLHHEGRSDEGRSLLERMVKQAADDEYERRLARRVLAAYLVSINQPAAEVLNAILDKAHQSPDDIAFVLSQPATWSNAAIARRGVDLLTEALGDASVRVSLAQATYILHFQRHEPAAMAQALFIVNGVLHRMPESLGALTLMSALHLASDPPDGEAATRQLRRAIHAHPRRVDLYPQLVALLQRQGDFATAESYLNRLGELSKRHENLRRAEIRLLESQGDFQSIISVLSERLANLTSEDDRAMLLTALHRAGRHSEAEEVAAALLELPNPKPETLGAVARFFADTRRASDGLALLHEYESAKPADGALLLGLHHHYLGSGDEAERWLLRAAQLRRDDPRPWEALTAHYLQLGDHREARRAARAGLAVAPNHRGLQMNLAVAALNLGDEGRREALALLDTIGREDRPLTETLNLYARITSREGGVPNPRDLDEAARLVRDHPSFLPAWRLAIAAHAQARLLERAADLAERAARRFPNQAEPAELAARILIDLHRPEHALKMAETWRQRSLNRTVVPDVVIASLLVDLGRPAEAADLLRPHRDDIVAQRSDKPEHLRALLRALVHGGDIDGAIATIRPLHQSAETAWAEMAPALAIGAAAEAREDLLTRLEPMLADAARGRLILGREWAQLAALTEEQDHFHRADEHALEAAHLDAAQKRDARLLRGLIADFRNDLARAEEHYRLVLTFDADNAMALNNLAHVLVRQGGRHEEAVELSRRALALLPDQPDVLDTHAQALLAAGSADAAERIAGRALEQRPEDAGALLTLTRIFLAQNRQQEANEAFDRASSVISSSRGVNAHVRSKHSEVERAILAAHLPESN